MHCKLILLGISAGLVCASGAPLSVRLISTLASPQPVGTPIGFSPRIENTSKGTHVFRYAVSTDGGPFRIVRDFTQARDFTYAAPLLEHISTVRVTVRNNETKETTETQVRFQFVPRVKGTSPVVTPTSHPLIALFSAPPCAEGSQFRVAFRAEGEEAITRTPAQACRGSITNNVYVAGMREQSEYKMRSELLTGGSEKHGEWLPFHTGIIDGDFAPLEIAVPRAAGAPVPNPVIIYAPASISTGRRPFATDAQGRMIWYSPAATDFLTRVLPGGHVLVLSEGQNTVNNIRRNQLVRELDIAGNILRETNVGRVAEQLESRGIHSDCKKGGKECVSGFHHEAIPLPNRHILVVAGLERMMPAGTQGSKEPVDILGDLVIELDEEFQVVDFWNMFDHLDIERKAYNDGKCKEGAGSGGCAPVFLAAEANGWTHTNALNYIPSAGDFLLSMPAQNWVMRVDWKNGKGSKKILWRLGKDGDFTAKSDDPFPWFSGQHDPGFEPRGSNILTIFDNGSLRMQKDPKSQSRGQVWQLDEEKKVATLVKNMPVGVFSPAVGSAQTLSNGGYNFEAGYLDSQSSPYGRTVELDKDGKIVFAADVHGLGMYRTFRVDDLYTAPLK